MKIIFILFCLFVSLSHAAVEVFSAHSSGYLMQIKNTVEIKLPTPEKLERIVGLNLEALALDFPEDPEPQANLAEFKDPATRPEAIRKAVEKLKLDDPVHWIKEQLKYPIFVDKERISVSIDEYSIQIKRVNPTLFEYSGTLVVIAQSNDAIKKLKTREVYYPLNPLEMYLNEEPFEKDLSPAKTKTPDLEYVCFRTDGHAIAPFNFFYFYDPYSRPKCLELTKSFLNAITKPELVEMAQVPVYPEFQELFKGTQIKAVVAFSKGAPPWGKNNFLSLKNDLFRRGYQIAEQHGDTNFIFKKMVGAGSQRRAFLVHILYEDSVDKIEQIFAKGALSDADLIFYSGHSGYGDNLFQLFNPSSNFPKRRYQIFFLQSCVSYTYATSNLLAAKALLDLDLDSYYVDTITTARSAYFHYFFPIISYTLSFFEKAANTYGTKSMKDFSYQRLITDIDDIETDPSIKAYYTVAGEEKNRFNPDVDPSTITAPPIDIGKVVGFLSKFINDPRQTAQVKAKTLANALGLYGEEIAEPVLSELKTLPSEILLALTQEIVRTNIDWAISPKVVEKTLAAYQQSADPGLRMFFLATAAAFNPDYPEIRQAFEAEIQSDKYDETRLKSLITIISALKVRSPLIEERLVHYGKAKQKLVGVVCDALKSINARSEPAFDLLFAAVKGELFSDPTARSMAILALAGFRDPRFFQKHAKEIERVFLDEKDVFLKVQMVTLFVKIAKQWLEPIEPLTAEVVRFLNSVSKQEQKLAILAYFGFFQIQDPDAISAALAIYDSSSNEMNKFPIIQVLDKMGYRDSSWLARLESEYQSTTNEWFGYQIIRALLNANYKTSVYSKILMDKFDSADNQMKVVLLLNLTDTLKENVTVTKKIFEIMKFEGEAPFFGSVPTKLYAALALLVAKVQAYQAEAYDVLTRLAKEDPRPAVRRLARDFLDMLDQGRWRNMDSVSRGFLIRGPLSDTL